MDLPIVNHKDYYAKIGDDHKFPINKFGELANYLINKKVVKKFHEPYPCSETTLKRAHSENYIKHIKNKTLDKISIKKIGFPLVDSVVQRSLIATGGTVLGENYHFDMTRPGIGLFGGNPLKNPEKVVTLSLPVLQIKDIKANEGVGYNHTFISKRKRKIAIVGSGYADGLSRQLSNSGILYGGDVMCPILGRISMDLITVDISNLRENPSFLTALGPSQTIDDLAEQSATIGYEILTSLGSRYKRVYNY